jgi:putative transposase
MEALFLFHTALVISFNPSSILFAFSPASNITHAVSSQPKVDQCFEKDQEELLAFYDFPADHWPHIRTSNPIESTFSTIRLRTKKTRAFVSRTTILTMVYKLGLSAEKGWRKLRGFRRLADVINGVKFINGIDEKTFERQRNAA